MLKKRKILLTVGIYPPEIGGPATYVYSFAKWLRKNNQYEVAVATASNCDIVDSNFRVFSVKKKIKLLWHIKYFVMILKNAKLYNLFYINGLFIESVLVAILKRKKYFIRIPGDVIWEKWKYKQGNNLSIDEFQKYTKSFKVNLLRKIRKFYLNKAEKIIAPSEYLAKLIEQWGVDKKKIEVIFNPYLDVKSEPMSLNLSNEKSFVAITGGRLVKWKGVGTVIKTCKTFNNVMLIIVGDGPEKKRLINLVTELNMDKKVVFTGSVSRGQLKTIFENSGCFILNSRYEGLPHIVLEAMSSRCPVAVSNAGGNTEVVKMNKNGVVFDIDNINAIRESIIKYRDNRNFTKVIKNNAKERIEKYFNQSIQFEKTESILFN